MAGTLGVCSSAEDAMAAAADELDRLRLEVHGLQVEVRSPICVCVCVILCYVHDGW